MKPPSLRNERETLEEEYAANEEGCFIFEVEYQMNGHRWWCLDATRAFNTFGRIINHSCTPNIKAKAVKIKGILRVGLLAKRDILVNDELTHDYGVQRAPPPWLRRRPPCPEDQVSVPNS